MSGNAQEQLDFLNATLQHLDEALGSMDALGKTAIVSSKARESTQPLNSSVFDKLLRRPVQQEPPIANSLYCMCVFFLVLRTESLILDLL